MGALSSSLVVLVLFSYFVQAGCGTTFCMLASVHNLLCLSLPMLLLRHSVKN